MAKYDVVVVGSGNAGMSAALYCILAGKKTLLIEKHNLPGGAASSFVRGRFEIEPSLHELCDYGPADNPGDIRQMLDTYGVKLDWVECKDCFRAVSKYHDGTVMDVTMPAGVEAFIDSMEKYVPGSRPKMTELFTLLDEIIEGISYTSKSKGNADPKVLQTKYANMLRTGAYSTNKVLRTLGIPQKCQDILQTYWSYIGIDLERLAFIHYAAMVHKYISRGAYIPKHTSHQLSTAMIERFRELGGEIWFNCRADEFLFDGKKLCGVKTNMGTIDCDYVLANINPDLIYGKMMPKELIPEREKKLSAARNRNMSSRMYTVYLCCDKSAEELGIKDYAIFLPETTDSVKAYNDMINCVNNDEHFIFLCYNVEITDFSPEGTCVCSFTTAVGPGDWNDLKQEDYFKFKNEMAKKMLKNLKAKTGIDLEGHIEEFEVATPWTFSRYLGVPEGAVYGYEVADWDGMMARMMSLDKDYPIHGLRPIGAAGPRGDGYNSAMLCGQLIASLAVRDLDSWKEGGLS
ncbi:MAG: NAD(P)/FAD-dependent oxidoreductase [Ruminococcaceae bacterium]|nr:NAD(P)/FAD-dependent oxidoreductase [Oscillospiraceae bacterium]